MLKITDDKGEGKNDIALIEGEKIILEDFEVADVMNDFFWVHCCIP